MKYANIKNVNGDHVKACMSFPYKGFEISFSTIPRNAEIIIWNEDGDSVYHEMLGTMGNAIQWVDDQYRR